MTNNSVTLKTSLLEMKTDRPILETADKLEGFIAKKFPEYPIFHNHIGNKYVYDHPRIQYKVVDQIGYILGIEDGAKLVKMVSEIDELSLGENVYKIKQKTFYDKDEIIMPTRKLLQYEFITPWLALNKENYQKFRILKDQKEKKLLLNNILRGNIISMCKGLGLDIEKDIYVHSRMRETRSMYKILRTSFTGEFRTNFMIPNFFGLGGKVSVGFGVIKNKDIE